MSCAVSQPDFGLLPAPPPSRPLPRELRDLRGFHEGESILVCGCGSSLSQLVCPEKFITIGVNDVGRLFQPDYLVVLNPRNQFQGDRFRFVEESRARAIFTQLDLGIHHPHVVKIRLGKFGGVDFSDPTSLNFTRNSPYLALCLAVHMGARRIGLIGVDFTDHHFFGSTGRHPLGAEFPQIDQEYKRLHAACVQKGVEVFNLSACSRLTAFPKLSIAEFTGPEKSQQSLRVVSYATTPVAGVPAILSRCISARTRHSSRTVWANNGYGNGVSFRGDVEWQRAPFDALELLRSADLIIAHNGKIDPVHRPLITGKPAITMAHNYMWNVDASFVNQGYPGVVVGQYQATLPEFKTWQVVPNPVPLWENEFQPEPKQLPITICYTPSGKHESYPPDHKLFWHSKGYATTMQVLQNLARRFPLRLEVIGSRQISHAESLAMKRRAHIVIDECVTGSYHRNSLEGLACGCVVVNAVGRLPAVTEVFRRCADGASEIPFVYASLPELERALIQLVEGGHEWLVEQGRRNRDWMETHWDFSHQWQHFWEPAVTTALQKAGNVCSMVTVPKSAQQDEERGTSAEIVRQELREGVSVVVCHGGEERLPHLVASLANLRQCPGVSEIIVADMGCLPCGEDVARRWADKYVFIRNDGAFERARCLNIGTALAEYDLVLWRDNDLIVPLDFIAKAVKEMRARQLDYLIPYSCVNYLSPPDSQGVMQETQNPADCRPVKIYRAVSEIHGAAGLVRKSFVLRYGGLSENFRGWGGEDNAWWFKACLLGRAGGTLRADQHLYHLFHPNSGGYGGTGQIANNPYYSKNLAVLREMRSIRDPSLFLKTFPPPARLSCAWENKRTVFITDSSLEGSRWPAYQTAQALTGLIGVKIDCRVASNGDFPWKELTLPQPPDSIVIFGSALGKSFLSDDSLKVLWSKAIVVHPGGDLTGEVLLRLQRAGAIACFTDSAVSALEQAGLRPWRCGSTTEGSGVPISTALALLQPLSVILGGATPLNVSEGRTASTQATRNSNHGNCSTDLPVMKDIAPPFSLGSFKEGYVASGTAEIGNIFACLVHESQECVIDLVRNLRFFDPSSLVLLYNGGRDTRLLDSRFPFGQYGAIVHPQPRPLAWGRLHEFALDCMQFALDHFHFHTLTVVDSDQLAIRPEYSSHLAAFLSGRTKVGMLSNSPAHQPPNTRVSPAQAAYREIDLWRPFLRRFQQGEKEFVRWSFWPSTVFTADAARDLTQLFASDRTLQEIMGRTKIWASEEVILPTVVALLGYEITASPFSYDYVKYRTNYTLQQIAAALARRDAFWVHPVPRRYDDPLRKHMRSRFDNYENRFRREENMPTPETPADSGLLLTWPILKRMRQIEGWLEDDEADLLIAATAMALTKLPQPHALVEVGSYCGRSTVLLGSVVKTLCPAARVYAIDPHDGKVGALDQGIRVMPPTLERLKRNLADAGLADLVTILPMHSWEVAWDRPIGLLFIDGLHDYANVARDFYHFELQLAPGGYVAFHDYADYYPGVKAFVNELLRAGHYQKVCHTSSMMVVKRIPKNEAADSVS